MIGKFPDDAGPWMTLSEAISMVFPGGGVTVRTLRAEIARGRLQASKIGGQLVDGRRAQGNAGAPTVLCAYGRADADVLALCGIDGQFVPLRLPRLVAVAALEQTWLEAVADYLANCEGSVALAELYRAFARHPKARGNRNVDAKIRQVLQRGPFERVRAAKEAEIDQFDGRAPMTFGVASSRWWDEKGEMRKDAPTLEGSLAWLQEKIGLNTMIASIDDNVVARLVTLRRADGVSPSTVNRSMTEPLRAILTRAKLWGQVVKDIRWGEHKLKEPDGIIREATADDEARAFAALRADLRPVTRFLLIMGWRAAEATLEASKRRCPFLLNLLDALGVIESGRNAVTLRQLVVMPDLVRPYAGEDEALSRKRAEALIAAFPDHPETLLAEDLSVLRELFGAPLFTQAYPLAQLPIIKEL